MARIATYVFIDLETTSIPRYEHNKTRITELSMIAMKRKHMTETNPGELPRVVPKLTMCFYPGKFIDPGATEASGLDNDLLVNETKFNITAFNAINSFLECQQKPLCLVAENGHTFDFPILKNHIEKLNLAFANDVMCADSLHAFYDILKMDKWNGEITNGTKTIEVNDKVNTEDDNVLITVSSTEITEQCSKEVFGKSNESVRPYNELSFKKQNETTPKSSMQLKAPKNIKEVRRKLFYERDSKPKESYRLKDIYERVLGKPGLNAHRAEIDCIMAAEISVAKVKEFVEWVDANHCPFSEVKAMTPGVPVGY